MKIKKITKNIVHNEGQLDLEYDPTQTQFMNKINEIADYINSKSD